MYHFGGLGHALDITLPPLSLADWKLVQTPPLDFIIPVVGMVLDHHANIILQEHVWQSGKPAAFARGTPSTKEPAVRAAQRLSITSVFRVDRPAIRRLLW
jgi:hypothetical protein